MLKMTYAEALSRATLEAMEENEKMLLMGEGVDDCKGVFGTTLEAFKRFGKERVWDMPLSEAAFTAMGIGAAIEGSPVLQVHQRNEFLLYAMDAIVNHAAKWRYMSGGRTKVPLTIRALIGRGWGQAAQHSQGFHSLFAYVPGLKVILPATPNDAKGLLLAALRDPNPVICLEHRWLYAKEALVPESAFELPIGKLPIQRSGEHLTCVASSLMVYEALEIAKELSDEGIEMEIINLHTVRPLDTDTILTSVRKTGRLLVLDIGHELFGVSAEILAQVCEKAMDYLKCAPRRIGLPDTPIFCSYALEKHYYPSKDRIRTEILEMVEKFKGRRNKARKIENHAPSQFQGPF